MCDQSHISDTPYSDTAPNRRDVTLLQFNKSDSELNVVQQHQQMMQSLPIENRKKNNKNKMVMMTTITMGDAKFRPNQDQDQGHSSKVQHHD